MTGLLSISLKVSQDYLQMTLISATYILSLILLIINQWSWPMGMKNQSYLHIHYIHYCLSIRIPLSLSHPSLPKNHKANLGFWVLPIHLEPFYQSTIWNAFKTPSCVMQQGAVLPCKVKRRSRNLQRWNWSELTVMHAVTWRIHSVTDLLILQLLTLYDESKLTNLHDNTWQRRVGRCGLHFCSA